VSELQQRIREARRRAMLSQTELAERSGVSRGTVARLELGLFVEPTPRTMRGLSRALNAALADVGHEPMPLDWLRFDPPERVTAVS
jgi:transcriptional regulator with XRE-family HTH domain